MSGVLSKAIWTAPLATDSGAIARYAALCPSSTQPGKFTLASKSNLAAVGGNVIGVALTAAAAGAEVDIIVTGISPHAALGRGVPSAVGVDARGMLARADSGRLLGWCDSEGTFYLGTVLTGAASGTPYDVNVTTPPFGLISDDSSAAVQVHNRTALQAAIDGTTDPDNSQRARRVYIPRGKYYFDDTVHVRRSVVLEGDGVAADITGTMLMFPGGKTGIMVDFAGTDRGSGLFSELRNLAVQATAKTTAAHGIHVYARCTIVNVAASLFKGDGFHFDGGSGVPGPAGNDSGCSNCVLIQCRAALNDGWGFNCDLGSDNSPMLWIGCDSQSNLAGDFRDSSYFGMTMVGCAANSETSDRRYESMGGANHTVMIGCYSEGVYPPGNYPYVYGPAIALGGTLAADALERPDNTGLIISWVGVRNFSSYDIKAPPNLKPLRFYPGRDDGSTVGSMVCAGEGNSGVGWSISENVGGGYPPKMWLLSVDANQNLVSAGVTRPSYAGTHAKDRPGMVWIPEMIFGGPAVPRRVFVSGGPPTSGNYNRGDMFYYHSPRANGRIGGICVESGSPGVWKDWGQIDP
jgi:hypothetical protein